MFRDVPCSGFYRRPVEIALQTLKRGTKDNPIVRIFFWNYTVVVQNTNIITHTTHNVHDEDCKRMALKKKHLREAESKTCQQWIYLLSTFTRRHTASKFGGVKYGVQLVPNEAYLDGDWNTTAFSVYENSDLFKPNLSPLLGECAALLLFLCYDIHDAVGVSDWLVDWLIF